MSLKLSELKSHPAQPPGRCQDTTSLQASIREADLLVPIIISADNYILSGHRRVTAFKALKVTELPDNYYVRKDFNHDDKRAMIVVLASNEQKTMTHMELVFSLQYFEKQHNMTLTQAARRVGISPTQASFLSDLAKAPACVQAAVEKYDRTGEGLPFTAFKEMAGLSAEEQIAQVQKGRTKISQVKEDRKKAVAKAKTERALEDPKALEALLTDVATIYARLGNIYAFLGNGAKPDDKAMLREALTPSVRMLHDIRGAL